MSLTSPTVSPWAYRPGSWYAVVGSNATVLLPAEQKEVVIGLWAAVDAGAAFDEVLDALLASGLSKLPAFAVVSGADGPVRVLVRGTGVHAEIESDGEQVTVDGTAGGTWTERTFASPTALRLLLPAAGGADAGDADPADAGHEPWLQVVGGLVRVGRLERPSPLPTVPAPTEPPAAAPAAAPVVAPVAVPAPEESVPAPQPEVVDEPEVADSDMGPATELLSAVDDPLSAPLPHPLPGTTPEPPPSAPAGAAPAGPPSDPLADPLSDPLADPLGDPLADPLSDPLPEPSEPAEAGPEPEVVDEPEVADSDMGPATELLSAVDDPLSAPLPHPLPGTTPEPPPSAPAGAAPAGPPSDPLADPLSDPLADPLGDPLADPLSDPLPEPSEPAEAGPEPDGWVTPWGSEEPASTDEQPAEPDPDTRPPGSEPPAVAGDPPEMTVVPGQPAAPYGSGADLPPPPLGIGAWEPAGPTPPANDHDGLTRAGDVPPPPVAPVSPGGFEAAPPAPAVTPPVAQLVISDGQTVVVDRVVLVGRAPEARRFTSTEQPRLITVPSRQHEISSTHVEVRPGTGADHGSAVVTDMGSTNGTVLVQPGLGPEDLKPGIAVQLIPGAVIDLGDGITIQVARP